jgi:hypothetical protein
MDRAARLPACPPGSPAEKPPDAQYDNPADGTMLQVANKLLEVSKMRVDSVAIAIPTGPSTNPARKYRQASPPKVDAPATDTEEASTQVSSDDMSGRLKSPLKLQRSKLLVLNVHGTLLDCNLIDEPNPNRKIRYTMKTASRRVVYRPWLAQFLSKCFLYFEVAFWGSKSENYIEEIVPAMLRRSQEDIKFHPVFVWSQQDCEPIEFEGGVPILWGKPLERLFQHWPCWNKSNTLIIDHKLERVGYNRGANVIVTKPFYVVDMKKLGDDTMHLKSSVWPLLEKFYGLGNVLEFRKQLHGVLAKAGVTLPKKNGTEHEPGLPCDSQGEGTGEPRGSLWMFSPHLALKLISNRVQAW